MQRTKRSPARVGDITREGWGRRSVRREFSRADRKVIDSLFGHELVKRVLVHNDDFIGVVDNEDDRCQLMSEFDDYNNVSFTRRRH